MSGRPAPVTAAEIATRDDLPDWRVVLNRLEARFTAPSFGDAAALIADIAAAADAAEHHPDVDLRYPGRVHVVLTTHATGGLSDLDVSLALEISRLAAAREATSEPLVSQAVEIALDAVDIPAVLPFWRAVLGYVDDAAPGSTGPVVALRDPARIGPPMWFQQADERHHQPQRFHLDVSVPHDLAEERIAAALAAGGTLVTHEYARSWWVLADAEGNQACVCTWQDRG